jgi:parvulin-like peptidyl-prolyl isomerase
MQYELFTNQVFQRSPQVLPEAAFISLRNELTLVTRAESELGITATPEEIATALRDKANVPAGADEKTFADAYKRVLDSSGLRDSEYRRLVTAEVLETKIRDKFTREAPPSIIQAKVEVIQAANEEDARRAIERINAGEPWPVVAQDLSQAADVATTGGVQDFAPQGGFNPAYDDFAFSSNIGQLSDPLSTGGATAYVVRVIDRQDLALKEEQKPAYVDRKYGDWLTDTQAKMDIKRDWTPEAQADALSSVLDDIDPARLQPPPVEVPQQQQPQLPAGDSEPAPPQDMAPQDPAAPPEQPPPADGQ